MNDNLEFELEVPSVKIAKERVAEVKAEFGEDVYIIVKIIGEDKSNVLSMLDEVLRKTAAQIVEKISEHKGEK